MVEKDVGRGEQCRFCLLTKFINAGPSMLAARRSGHPWANIVEKPAQSLESLNIGQKRQKSMCKIETRMSTPKLASALQTHSEKEKK